MTKVKQKKANKTEVEQNTKRKRHKVSNYDNVDSGVCPRCDAKTLGDEVAGKGDGITRTCSKCQHKWYLNRKIHTCKCLSKHGEAIGQSPES